MSTLNRGEAGFRIRRRRIKVTQSEEGEEEVWVSGWVIQVVFTKNKFNTNLIENLEIIKTFSYKLVVTVCGLKLD
jgi:hypothetical protein